MAKKVEKSNNKFVKRVYKAKSEHFHAEFEQNDEHSNNTGKVWVDGMRDWPYNKCIPLGSLSELHELVEVLEAVIEQVED